MRRQTLALLQCPACGGGLETPGRGGGSEVDQYLLCGRCDLSWPVEDGIPNLIFPPQLEEGDAASQSLWERIGGFYDLIGSLTNAMRGVSGTRERQLLVDRLDLRDDSIVLETAAGTGLNLRVMAGRIGSAGTVIGLDLSRRMIRQAQRRLSKDGLAADLILGNAQQLPFHDGAFDTVLDGFGTKYYPDKNRAVQEMLRVVKPGGKVVIAELGVPQSESLSTRQRLLRTWIPHFDEPPPLAAIPAHIDTTVSWDANHTAYAIEFRKTR